MTITMIPTVPSAWDRIKELGAERASWKAPVLHLQCDFDTDTVYSNLDHHDGVLGVDFGAMRHFLYVASTFERAVEVCLWDLQQKQQVQFVTVDPGSRGPFRYARYAFSQRWHHVSVVKLSGPVYRSFHVRANDSDEELVGYVRQML